MGLILDMLSLLSWSTLELTLIPSPGDLRAEDSELNPLSPGVLDPGNYPEFSEKSRKPADLQCFHVQGKKSKILKIFFLT